MRRILPVLSWAALAANVLPAVLFFRDELTLAAMQAWMLAATVAWFVVTPLWMGRGQK